MNNIILLNELKKREFYDTALFLTYTINLRFFESMILPRLRRMGISRIGILIDYRGYQESLENGIPSGLCGREYILAPVHLPRGGIQHAKLLWLQKHDRITAYIGSHNLTMAGYNDQTEVTAKLVSMNPSHTQALQQIHDDISLMVPPCLYYVWQHIKPPTVIYSPSNITMMSSRHRPLLNQLIEKVQFADEIRVITPFLDAQALKHLAKGVQAQTIVLDLPQDGPDTPLSETMHANPHIHPRFLYSKRRLHAKAYQFRNAHTSSVALGSANCTQAALMRNVAEGGNLEYLLFIEENVATSNNYLDEVLDFRPINDVEAFPHTGRDWTTSSSEFSSILFIEEATFKDGILTVKWSEQDNLNVEDATLTTDTGESIYCGDRHEITRALQKVPQRITLEAIANEDFCKTHAWVINYTALNASVATSKQSTWIERIATNNFLELPNSIAIWLEQAVQDYLAITPDNELPSINMSNVKERHIKMRQYREVFAFSSNLDLVRNTARSILKSDTNVYNFDLLRMLLTRPNAELPINSNIENQEESIQRYTQQRRKAFKGILREVDRYLCNLSRTLQSLAFAVDNEFVARLKIGLGTIACVCIEVKDSSIEGRERLLEHFIDFLIQLNKTSIARDLVRMISIQGPLLLCIGAITPYGENRREYFLQLKNQAQNLVRTDPRSILAQWEKSCDTRGLQDIQVQVERHIFSIFEVASSHLGKQVEKRWSCLLKLQEADRALSTERSDLYKQAKEKYEKEPSTNKIWSKYKVERQRGKFPVIFFYTGKICPACYVGLSDQKIQELQRAEAVICDNCQKILVAK
ncbi:hypothetical protein KDH_66510 [Dictyobacter sp. S3.2.2.5]|uniref:PLD phosphodiesterase domain-containing protein n=1 Tax=Dictyobacter halimunensis TaxID=3026934 RepID=A0ABQ6G3L3_9CHLR|nr:hypothetical protein KDH_66510 [Dictyobacter sp. S3.2.2.5]